MLESVEEKCKCSLANDKNKIKSFSFDKDSSGKKVSRILKSKTFHNWPSKFSLSKWKDEEIFKTTSGLVFKVSFESDRSEGLLPLGVIFEQAPGLYKRKK